MEIIIHISLVTPSQCAPRLMAHNSTTTGDILTPLSQEIKSINYEWVALESLSDLLCVMLALYVGLQGMRKIWPYHEGYAGSKKGFIWLAARWGVGNYPHLFRTFIGLTEIAVFLGCLMCFLPGPTSQLITCLSLIVGMCLCVCFLVTHSGDPWSQRLVPIRHIFQAAIALAIRLGQDFDWEDRNAVWMLYAGSGATVAGLIYMGYRRVRFGKIPDPLLG